MVVDMANNTKSMNTMLTVREVSRLLHVHSNTLRRWSDQGIIKAYRIGPRGDRRFRPEDIAVLLLEESKGIPPDKREVSLPGNTNSFAMSR
jgi:excisionase family DNA binding protein